MKNIESFSDKPKSPSWVVAGIESTSPYMNPEPSLKVLPPVLKGKLPFVAGNLSSFFK